MRLAAFYRISSLFLFASPLHAEAPGLLQVAAPSPVKVCAAPSGGAGFGNKGAFPCWVRILSCQQGLRNGAMVGEKGDLPGDSGMLAPDWNTPGFFFGFTGPRGAFGEIGIRTAEKQTSFSPAVLLDGVRMDANGSRVLESAVISHGDPQDELRHWIGTCRKMLGPARVRPPVVGDCSW